MRRILRKVAAGEYEDLGDTTTLADPTVVQALVDKRVSLVSYLSSETRPEDMLVDRVSAKECFTRSLEVDPSYVPAMRALRRLMVAW